MQNRFYVSVKDNNCNVPNKENRKPECTIKSIRARFLGI